MAVVSTTLKAEPFDDGAVGASRERQVNQGQESTAEEQRTGRAQKNQSAKEQSIYMAGFEDFVDADRAAEFLSIHRETIIRWARNGTVPGHPLGAGRRRVWRFRFSELSKWAASQVQSGYRPCSER
jgi:excisionase family DNA binding protein